MTAISVRDVQYVYPDSTTALSGVSFSLEEEGSLGIVGPNGAGKTTLFLCICGLLRAAGRIHLFGEELTAKNAADLRKMLSYVFQNPNDQLFMPTVEEDVAFGLGRLGHSPDEVREIVSGSLGAVGLAGFESRSAHHLSLGEKKKVCLAAALARRSPLMLFDEPTSELDPAGRREFIRLIGGIDATKIVASHDLNLIVELCPETVIINDGRISAAGDTVTLLGNEDLMAANDLEVPLLLRLRA